ncbi:calcium-binding protein, partial [Arcobacter sp.]|uniref:calcium-binding protein n=1 Tax=Arcobacter sp. TaxID=1872629 RepID=UPI003C75B7F2
MATNNQSTQTVQKINPQTSDVTLNDKDILDYKNDKVVIKEQPNKGENVAVYVRPGDEIDYDINGLNIDKLDYRLVGGDIVVTLPKGGIFTFVSMALMGYSENPPSFKGVGGQTFSLGQVLSQVEEVNDLPMNSLPVEADIQREDNVKKIVEELEEKIEKVNQIIVQQEIMDEDVNKYDKDSHFDYEEPPTPPKEPEENEYSDDNPSNPIVTPGENAEVEGVLPTLTFDINIQHIEGTQEITGTGTDTLLSVIGGGGSLYANDYPSSPALSELQKQTNAEDLDYSSVTNSIAQQSVIRADNKDFFGEDYTSRLIKLSPSQPAGFGVTVIKVSGLPGDVSIVGGTSQGGGVWLIHKADAINAGFTVNPNNGEINFAIKYNTNIVGSENFEMTIEAESVWSADNLPDSLKADAEQPVVTSITFENSYGVNIKEVDPDSPLSYRYSQVGDNSDGFVLATNLNDNIIRTGDINTTVIGGSTTDTIFAQSGNDTLNGNKGDDTIAPGLGNDTVDGGEGIDTVSYSNLAVSNVGAGVEVDLDEQKAVGSGNDTLISIENIIGSSFRDTLTGNDSVNIINGGAGNDTLDGKLGNDTLLGDAGNDTIKSGFGDNYIDGGVGTNTVDYTDLGSGVNVKLLSPSAVTLGETWGEATS